MSLVKNKNTRFGVFAAMFIFFAAMSVVTGFYSLVAIPFVLLFFYASWQTMPLIFLVLLFSLPFSAEYMVTETLGTDFPDELLMVVTAFLFLGYWIFYPVVLPGKVRRHPLLILLLLGFCWAILSSLFSTQPIVSIKFLLAKGWYIGAFVMAPLIFFTNKLRIRKAVTILVAAMIIVVILVLVRHARYGYTFEGINNAVRPFFRNHVNYSTMLACLVPVVFVHWRSVKAVKAKWRLGFVLLIMLVALFLSYGRGAWLALIIGIITAWLIKKKVLLVVCAAATMIFLTTIFWIKDNDRYLDYAHDYKTTIWHKDFSEHITATYQLKDVSTAERFYRWIAGIRMIKDNWLTGYGPNSFYYNYKPYTIPAFKTWVSDNEEHSTVHNYFLLVAIEQGIPGLIIFLLLAGMLLYYAQYLYHRIDDNFYKKAALVTGVILMMILTVNFVSDLIETDKIGSLFFLCLSLLVITDVNTRGESNVE
jgi:O-antigen ligase